MSKKPLVKKSTSDEGKKNELHVPTSMNSPTWDIKIWGEDERVENYHDLSADLKKNRAVITLGFDSGKDKYSLDNLEKGVTYRVVNPNPSTWEEWKKMRNEALTDFIINKSSGLLDESKPCGQDLSCTLQKEGDKKVKVLVEKRDGTDSKVIGSMKIDIESEFYHKEIIKEEEFVPLAPKPKPAWWKTTRGKITIGIVVGVILLLLLIFHKKIWSWMKGEKKKSPETIIL